MQNTTSTVNQSGLWTMVNAHKRWFLALAAAAFALRLFFVLRFPAVTPDGILYADIAKNWLLHGVYGMSGEGPTYIRLPGYPAFMAVLFAIAGIDHYNAVRFAQVFIDVGTCFVIADVARRTVVASVSPEQTESVARWALALAALCPFLANYTAVPLTETPAIFLAVLALDLAVAALDRQNKSRGGYLCLWAACGLAIAAGIYIRPDGGIMLIVIGGYLLFRFAALLPRSLLSDSVGRSASRTFWAGVILGIFSLAPLAPWTLRNWRDFHEFQPLAPAAANVPGEFVPHGFERWQNTWLADYASVEEIAFRMDGEPLPFDRLPNRAFDNDDERRRTETLFAEYNDSLQITPELDARFAELAGERIRRHPLRYYMMLPLARAFDLWLRPRTEILPLNVRWWNFRDDPRDFGWAVLLGAVNLGYLLPAVLGLTRWRAVHYAGMLAALMVVRTAVITILHVPEPRYVLECFPAVIVFGAAGIALHQSISVSPDDRRPSISAANR